MPPARMLRCLPRRPVHFLRSSIIRRAARCRKLKFEFTLNIKLPRFVELWRGAGKDLLLLSFSVWTPSSRGVV